jgi:hypothetical protein
MRWHVKGAQFALVEMNSWRRMEETGYGTALWKAALRVIRVGRCCVGGAADCRLVYRLRIDDMVTYATVGT